MPPCIKFDKIRTSSKLRNIRQICFLGKGNDGLSVFTFHNRWVLPSPWSPWQTDCYQSSTWWSVIKVVMWNRRTKSCSNVSAAHLGEIIFNVVCRIFTLMVLNFIRYFFKTLKLKLLAILFQSNIVLSVKKSKQNKITNGPSFRILLFKISKTAGVWNWENYFKINFTPLCCRATTHIYFFALIFHEQTQLCL